MTDRLNRPWFQFHLAPLVLMTVAAAVCLTLNLTVQQDVLKLSATSPSVEHPRFRWVHQGWPFCLWARLDGYIPTGCGLNITQQARGWVISDSAQLPTAEEQYGKVLAVYPLETEIHPPFSSDCSSAESRDAANGVDNLLRHNSFSSGNLLLNVAVAIAIIFTCGLVSEVVIRRSARFSGMRNGRQSASSTAA